VTHDVLLRNLADFADDTPGNLQSLFDRTPAKSILRDVSPSADSTATPDHVSSESDDLS
jgi:hypothetical protein